MPDTKNDIEYYIYKAACAIFQGMEVEDIHALFKEELKNEDIYLVIAAGKVIANDWQDAALEEMPTRPN